VPCLIDAPNKKTNSSNDTKRNSNKTRKFYLDLTNNTEIKIATLLVIQTNVLLTTIQNQVYDFHSWQIDLSQSPRQLKCPDAGAVTPNSLSLSSPMLFFNQVFNHRKQEKLLSADATLTGKVSNTFRRACTIEYTSLSHCFKVSSAVIGKIAVS